MPPSALLKKCSFTYYSDNDNDNDNNNEDNANENDQDNTDKDNNEDNNNNIFFAADATECSSKEMQLYMQ